MNLDLFSRTLKDEMKISRDREKIEIEKLFFANGRYVDRKVTLEQSLSMPCPLAINSLKSDSRLTLPLRSQEDEEEEGEEKEGKGGKEVSRVALESFTLECNSSFILHRIALQVLLTRLSKNRATRGRFVLCLVIN